MKNPTLIGTKWIPAAFLFGVAVGGFGGWEAGRHHGGLVPGSAGRPGHDGRVSNRNDAVGESPDARQKPATDKFAPSGDPAADFHRILRLRDATARAGAFRQLLASLPPEGIVKLMEALRRYGEDQEQEDEPGGLIALMAARQILIEDIAQHDPGAVLAALAAAGAGTRIGDCYADILRGWAARDPEAARRFFEENTLQDKTADAKGIAGALVREMVKTDPEGTFRWLRGLQADFADDVAHDALQTLSHLDGVKAGQLLAENNDLKKAPEFVAAMTAGWARTEPEKAFDWATKLPANIAASGIKTAAGAWAEKDFPGALTAVKALQGDQLAAALNGMAAGAGGRHLDELLPLVDALPESGDRAAAVGSLMGSWVDKSPADAGAWLADQPAGASRDQGAVVLALKSLDRDPQAAIEWVSMISAKDQREQGLDGVIEQWLKKDPAAARTWVQQSDRLTEADRARLLEKTGR